MGFVSYTIHPHGLFIPEEAYTTMIIAHSRGEEVIMLYTSTIVISYLVNYIDGIHFVNNEIRTLYFSSPKSVYALKPFVLLPLHVLAYQQIEHQNAMQVLCMH